MYLFSMPDGYAIRTLNKAVLYALKEHPDWFYDDFQIETAYGCPALCIWNGNRIELVSMNMENWQEIIQTYTEFNIRYRLTFTNFLLQPEHLYDTYANAVAAELDEVGGYVMVSTPLMANYMRRYPNLKVCWSTTTDFGKGQQEIIDKINELSENALVVLPYEFNNKPELDKFIHPENLEVLVNEFCIDNCPRRREHWTECNKRALYQKIESDLECFFNSQYGFVKEKGGHRHHIDREMLEDYTRRGINHFKISGRLDIKQAALAYFEYFVRREHYQSLTEFFVECNNTNFGKGWEEKEEDGK